MKAIKITYWSATGIVSLMMLFSAYNYLTADQMKQAFTHLGFPSYFRVELAVTKILGAVFLLLPVSAKLKEWIYAGFTIVFISAFIAHISSGDPAQYFMMPIIFLLVLAASYASYHKLQNKSTSKAATGKVFRPAAYQAS